MNGKDVPDFKDASLDELEEMQRKLSQYIDRRLQARKEQALAQIKALALEHDLTFEEVVAVVRTATKRGKAPAIYRNPENPRQTWSGKGDAPEWFKKHPDPEKLRIPGA